MTFDTCHALKLELYPRNGLS